MKQDNSYEYISAILEKRSVSEAARSLYMAQPSLSQYIDRLERELGAELFVPNRRPPVLSEAGEIYMRAEERMRSIRAQMLNQIQELRDLKRGTVTVGSSHYRSMTILVNAIPRFRARYPGVEIRVEEGHTAALEDAAARNITDFSLVMLPLTHPELEYTPLFTEEILLAMPPDHSACVGIDPEKQRPPYPVIDGALLRDMPVIMIKKGQHLRTAFADLLSKLQIEPDVVMETDDMPTAQSLAAVGVGATLVTDRLAETGLCTRRPVYFSIRQLAEKRRVVAAYDRRSPLSKAARAFLEEVIASC